MALLSHGYIEHIAQLKAEIREYEKMRESPLPKVLKIRNFDEISRQIVRLRLARGFTQAKLASRIGVSRLMYHAWNERIIKGTPLVS